MSKPKLISISGSVHAGKTTISRMLALENPNAAYVDGDMLGELVKMQDPNNQTGEERWAGVHKVIIEMLRANIAAGVDVVVDYPFTDETRREIAENLKDLEFEPFWFLLKPDKDKVLKGSASRPKLTEWEIERINYHYSSPLMETNMAVVIDSTNQTSEETAAEVRKCIINRNE